MDYLDEKLTKLGYCVQVWWPVTILLYEIARKALAPVLNSLPLCLLHPDLIWNDCALIHSYEV